MYSEKVKQALKNYREAVNSVNARAEKKKRCVEKQLKLRALADQQRSALADAEIAVERISVQVALDDLPIDKLEQAIAAKTAAANALTAADLTFASLEKEVARLDREVDPSKAHPLTAARGNFFAAVYEDARDELLRGSAVEQLSRCYVLLSLAAGTMRVGDSLWWNVLLQTLEIPAPDAKEVTSIAEEFEAMLK